MAPTSPIPGFSFLICESPFFGLAKCTSIFSQEHIGPKFLGTQTVRPRKIFTGIWLRFCYLPCFSELFQNLMKTMFPLEKCPKRHNSACNVRGALAPLRPLQEPQAETLVLGQNLSCRVEEPCSGLPSKSVNTTSALVQHFAMIVSHVCTHYTLLSESTSLFASVFLQQIHKLGPIGTTIIICSMGNHRDYITSLKS